MKRFFSAFSRAPRDGTRPAFTLIEMLITLTLFAVVGVVAVNTLVTGMRASKKIQAEVFLYNEASSLMDRIAQDFSGRTVDYEAYFSRNVLQETGWDTPHYGQYAQSFFHPGSGGTEAGPYADVPAWYRATCADGSSTYPDDCSTETPVYSELDTQTGVHPFTGSDAFGYDGDAKTMNAFCESEDGSTDCETVGMGFSKELLLISGAGDERVIYGRELRSESSQEYGLSRLVMKGEDESSDGIVDTWFCAEAYDCTAGTSSAPLPDPDDLSTDTDAQSPTDFVPLLPETLDLSSFWVQITPLENPYLAFAEPPSQIQPQVTVSFTLTLSAENSFGLLGELPSITLQRTFTSDVRKAVTSYK